MRLTASSLGIARTCGWAFRADTVYPVRPSGDGAEESNALHGAIADTLVGEKSSLPLELVDMFNPAMGHLAQYGLENVRPEVTFAWDPATGKARRLGMMLDRDYSSARPEEVCGTVDYLVVRGDHVVIGDWKAWATSNVTPSETNAQLAFGALCAAQVYGVKKAIVEIVGLEDRRARVDRSELRYLELMRWDAEFRRILAGIPGSSASAGGHCTWCPALGACPANEQTLPAQQLVHLSGKKPSWSTNALGFDNDVLMAEHLPALEKAVEAVKKSLQERYPNGIELDNGKTWKPIKFNRASFNKEKALQILGSRAVECQGTIEVEQWRKVNTKK